MVVSRQFVAALALAGLGVTTAVTVGADNNTRHTTYLTFNRPVALPGVALGAGTYIFEFPDSNSHSVVQVLSRDRRIMYLMADTRSVKRPADPRGGDLVSFGEAAPDRAQPITVWWADNSEGRQFVYAKP